MPLSRKKDPKREVLVFKTCGHFRAAVTFDDFICEKESSYAFGYVVVVLAQKENALQVWISNDFSCKEKAAGKTASSAPRARLMSL